MLYVFGSGDLGQLGLGDTLYQSVSPVEVKYFRDKEIEKVAVGGAHTLVLDREGTIHSWGCNDDGALGRSGDESIPLPVVFGNNRTKRVEIRDIACGDSVSVAIDKNGFVYEWGSFRNERGVLGFDRQKERGKNQRVPRKVGKIKFTKVACGYNHILGLDEKGVLYSRGDGFFGQLGRRVSERMREGGLVLSRVEDRIQDVGAGGYHSMCVKRDGRLLVAGLNNHQQLGDIEGKGRPAVFGWEEERGRGGREKRKIKKVKGGEHFTMVLDGEGGLWGVGRNDSGQLGVGDLEGRGEFTKTRLGKVEDFDTSGSHVVALCKGRVFTWGFGEVGQLGYNEECSSVPKEVKIEGVPWIVGAGGQHTVVVTRSLQGS